MYTQSWFNHQQRCFFVSTFTYKVNQEAVAFVDSVVNRLPGPNHKPKQKGEEKTEAGTCSAVAEQNVF